MVEIGGEGCAKMPGKGEKIKKKAGPKEKTHFPQGTQQEKKKRLEGGGGDLKGNL